MEYQVLRQRKKGTQFSPKVTEKGLQWKTRHQKQRKPDAIFVKEAKIENVDKHALPATGTFVKNIRKLFAFNATTNRRKLL